MTLVRARASGADDGRLHGVGHPADVLTPEVLREVFDVEARHLTDPATGRVHLVVGAGAPAPAHRKAHA